MAERRYKPSRAPDWHPIGPVGMGSPLEVIPVGSRTVLHPQPRNGLATVPAFTDARRDMNGDGRGVIGVQTRYLNLLPAGSPAIALWTGAEVDTDQAQHVLTRHLGERTQRLLPFRPAVLLTGGNHLHPDTTGNLVAARSDDVEIHGGLDVQRDAVGITSLIHADKLDAAFVGICRGYQLGIFHYSDGLAVPQDHGQDQHKVILTDGGPKYPVHEVRDILNPKIREVVKRTQGIEIPVIDLVNSAHAQGFKVSEIDENAMKLLNERGWYPWLVANVPDVKDADQTYEGWLRVINGRITGIMLQSHPEMDNAPYVGETRQLIHNILVANLEVPSAA